MKKSILCSVLFLFIAGCYVVPVTENNPFGIDPNELQGWVNFGVGVGQATQIAGSTMGNPAIVGVGILIGVLVTTVGGSLIKKGKK